MTQKAASQTKPDAKSTAMGSGGFLQRAAVSAAHATDAAPSVHEVLRASGRPLDSTTRAFMEPRFGQDFSGVRVHTDDRAAASAHAVQARAYTVGSDVVFGAGNYSPETTPGRQLLAHELTHVLQQQSRHGVASSSALSAAEGEAERSSQAVGLGRQVIPVGQRIGIGLARAMETKDLSKLSDEDLEAEHRRVQVWLGKHTMVELDYGLTQDYLQLIEAEVLRRNPSTNNTQSGLGSGKASTQASAPPGKSQLAPVKPDIAKLPGNLYVDVFTSVTYDLDYRHEGGRLSEWLRVNYADGTVIDVNINDILEKSMSSEEGRNSMAQGHVGAGGRIFPSELNPRTTPGLYAAKQSAIEAMEESNINFMKAALPAVIFIITIPAYTMGMNKPPTATRTAVPRAAARGGAAAKGLALAKIKPLNGVVNVGGGLEKGAEAATNLNPIVSGTGGPTAKAIPNLVQRGAEEIGEVFEQGSVRLLKSSRLPFGSVGWDAFAKGARKVMSPGGKVFLNVWVGAKEDAAVILKAFQSAGFNDAKIVGEGVGTILTATR